MAIQRYSDYEYDMSDIDRSSSSSLSEQVGIFLLLFTLYFVLPFLIWSYGEWKERKRERERIEIEKTKEVKPINEPEPTTSPKENTLEELCKASGIPFSRNQRQSGTASIRFVNKPKGKETE